MEKTITVIEQDADKIEKLLEQGIETDVVFEIIQRDTIGNSGASPRWGYVYSVDNGKLIEDGVGLYKEYDYDYPKAAYAEKIWSILGKKVLPNVRVPEIEIVEEVKEKPGLISHRIMDNVNEDLIHIRDVLFQKYERDELKAKRELFTIEELLECIKIQVKELENKKQYREIEKAVIQTLILDSITNNADRHTNNWALIRNKQTNHYELGVYDHTSAFIDMLDERKYFTSKGWTGSYIIMNENRRKIGVGDTGNTIVQYIFENYREYFDDFHNNFDQNIEEIIEEILSQNLKIDNNRLINKLRERKRFLKQFYRDKGELEYE